MSSRAVSITRTVRDLKKLGLAVTEVVVEPDGTIRVLTGPANENASGDELEQARERRRARNANRAA